MLPVARHAATPDLLVDEPPVAGGRGKGMSTTRTPGSVVGAMTTARGPGAGLLGLRLMLRLAGAGLLIATAAIHLDLYLTGYRTIPVIGWLFLLQVIAAFGLGLAVLAL